MSDRDKDCNLKLKNLKACFEEMEKYVNEENTTKLTKLKNCATEAEKHFRKFFILLLAPIQTLDQSCGQELPQEIRKKGLTKACTQYNSSLKKKYYEEEITSTSSTTITPPSNKTETEEEPVCTSKTNTFKDSFKAIEDYYLIQNDEKRVCAKDAINYIKNIMGNVYDFFETLQTGCKESKKQDEVLNQLCTQVAAFESGCVPNDTSLDSPPPSG